MPTRRQLCEAFATFALDEGASAEPVAVQLSKLLAANSIKIITLFKALDQSLSGSINRSEFEVGMRSLGLQVASTHVYDDLFSMWDQDGSGSLSLSELADVFNRSESASTKPLSNVDLDESDDAPPMAEQLKVALSVNSVAVISLFKSWDNDGNGMISLDEFEMGLRTCATLITLQATLITLYKRLSSPLPPLLTALVSTRPPPPSTRCIRRGTLTAQVPSPSRNSPPSSARPLSSSPSLTSTWTRATLRHRWLSSCSSHWPPTRSRF